jgi:hypothetical protein
MVLLQMDLLMQWKLVSFKTALLMMIMIHLLRVVVPGRKGKAVAVVVVLVEQGKAV